MNIAEFRAQYPQYDALPDNELATRLYQKHYADKLTQDDFGARFGVAPNAPADAAPQSIPTGLSQPGPSVANPPPQQPAGNWWDSYVSGEMAPVERSLTDNIVDPVARGVQRAKQGIAIAHQQMGGYGGEDGAIRLGTRLADLERNVQARNPTIADQDRLQDISGSESIGDALAKMAGSPDILGQVILESMGTMAPGLALTAGASVLGPAGTAIGAGVGSGSTEYAQSLLDSMRDTGLDPMDPRSWTAALQDEQLMAEARDKAIKRGVAIGAFDAMTAGLAGKILAGAKPTMASVGTRSAGELGVQAAGGAAGEGAAQALTGEYRPGDIALEAIAELPTAAVEVPGNINAGRRATGIKARADAEQALGDLLKQAVENAGKPQAPTQGPQAPAPEQPQAAAPDSAQAQPQPRQGPPQWTASETRSQGLMPGNVDVPMTPQVDYATAQSDVFVRPDKAEGKPEPATDSIKQRRQQILDNYERMTPEQQAEADAILADMDVALGQKEEAAQTEPAKQGRPQDQETFYAAIDDANAGEFFGSYTVDWGARDRQQGKRSGYMVTGAMSDAPVGKRSYGDPLQKLPDGDDPVVFEDYWGLRGAGQVGYLKSRAAGHGHETAMRVAMERQGELEPGSAFAYAQGQQSLQDTPPPDHAELTRNLPKNTVVGGPDKIAKVAEHAAGKGNANKRVRFAVVGDDEAATLQAKTGLALKGYKHTVDTYGIRHAMKTHGDPVAEEKRGQIPVTAEDFQRIPEIIASPDEIKVAGKDSTGNDLIQYRKAFNGTTFYVEEVRDGRQELVTKTLWKTRTPLRATPEGGVADTPEAMGRNQPELDESITPDSAESKSDVERPASDRPSEPVVPAEQAQPKSPETREAPADESASPEQPKRESVDQPATDTGQVSIAERAKTLGRDDPFGDVQALMDKARKRQEHQGGEQIDNVAQAVHDGQYEGVRQIAENQLPVKVVEDDIPADLAYRAFYNTSHSPDKRGNVARREYVQDMVRAWREVEPKIKSDENHAKAAAFFEKFRDGYAAELRAYLEAHSRVASAFITGPAKFPVAANEKRARSADKRLEEATAFYERGVKRLKKLATGDDDTSTSAQLSKAKEKLAQREQAQEQMKAANKVLRSKKLKDEEKRAQLRDIGLTDKQIDAINKPDFAGRTGFKTFELSNNNAEIRRLRQRVDALEAQSETAEATGGTESVSFDGGEIELDHAAGVLRIKHDEKPPQETIRALKGKGFRWSPKNQAWQRKLTNSARYDAENITGANLSEAGSTPSDTETKTAQGPGTLQSGFDPVAGVKAVRELSREAIDYTAEKLKPKADKFIYYAQDRFNSLKEVQKKIGNVPEDQDAYLAEERFHGRTRKRLDQFDEDTVQPMLAAIRGSGLTLEQVEEWLHARHAKEANAHLEEINPDMPDNTALSGMTNEEAAQILAKHKGNAKLQEVGIMVDDMNAARLDIIERDELDEPGNVEIIRNAYEHYVPLHREEVGGGGLPARGQGFNVKGKETKRRVGSTRKVVNILPHLVAQHQTTIVRAEKARVHRALYELAKANPDPDFWRIDKAAKKRVVGPDGFVRNAADPRYKERDNVLTVKKGGQEYTIEFNPDNEYAVRIAKGMKNLEQAQMGWLLRKMSDVNRWLSAVNTGWNPEFVISNLVRDLQTAAYNLSGTEAEGLATKVMKDWPKALKGIHNAVRGDKSHAWAKHFDEFEREGGRTGWMEHYETIEDFRNKLVREFDSLGDSGWAMTKRRAAKIATFVRDYNDIVENAIRLSVYVNAREAGVSPAKSASVAKNITVNFNRKGAIGPALNAAYLFYNASIQGSARLIQAVATSRRAQALVGGTIVFAAVLDMANRELGGDDDDGVPYYDKIPGYEKERNLIVMRGDGDYLKIPLPWGYNVFHVIGQELGSAFTKDEFEGAESAGRVIGSIIGAFSPIGSEGSGLQMVSPTLLDPAVQIAENKNFTGRKLMPVDFGFGAVTPESELYWNGARDFSKSLAAEMNAATGGNKAKAGAIDISPETIDLWIDFATGGLGRTVANTVDTAGKLASGELPETRNVPLGRKVVGEVTRVHDQTEYYDNLADIQTVMAQLKTYRGQPDMLRVIRAGNQSKLTLIPAAKKAEKEMRKLRKARREAIADGHKARQERIEARMDRVFKWFNGEYRKAISRDQPKPFGKPGQPIDHADDGEV